MSAKGRSLKALPSQFSLESFIQTDAAVNPGNSGGALVNTKGELVGINTLIQSRSGTYIGYAFAVPTSIVKKVVVDLKEHGVVQRAMLGIQYIPLTKSSSRRRRVRKPAFRSRAESMSPKSIRKGRPMRPAFARAT